MTRSPPTSSPIHLPFFELRNRWTAKAKTQSTSLERPPTTVRRRSEEETGRERVLEAYATVMASISHAGPSRGPDLWKPSRYLEPNHPDNEEVQEQAAYQAAVTRLSNDQRARRYKPRRTVDYSGGVLRWRQITKLKGHDYLPPIHPSPSDIVGVS